MTAGDPRTDREKASRLLDLAPMGGTRTLLDAVATALADERRHSAAALRRVQSVIEALEDQATVHEAQGLVTSHRPIARRLRRALGESDPRKVVVLHMVYPDGTHTGDCEGCLWSQGDTA